jgi:Response regulator containing CheY-like receiver domain and AraC-type DNA-binding domain
MKRLIIHIKKVVRKNTMLTKMLVSYLLIVLILLSAFAAVLYRSFSNSSMKEINKTSLQMLEQSYNTADILLGSTHNYFYYEYIKNSVIFNALNSKSFSGIDYFEIGKELNDILIPNALIYSIYLYNPNANTVFSNLNTLNSIDEFFDKDIIDIIKNQKFNSDEVFIPRRAQYVINGNKYDIDLITIIFTDANKISGKESAMVLNINQQTLQKMINKGTASDFSNSFIINNKGIIISHGDRNKLTQDIGSESYIKKILNNKKDKGSFTDTVEGRKYQISYIKSNRLGWFFINRSEYSQLFESMTTFQKFIFIITTIFIFIGILIAGYSTSKIYTPLRKLIKEISASDPDTHDSKELNEYEYLKGSFNKLSVDVSQLKLHVRRNSDVKRKELLRHILQDGVTNLEKYKADMEQAGIDFSKKYFKVIVLQFDSCHELKDKYSLEDLSLFRFAISNIANELLSSICKVESYEDEAEHVAIILNSENSIDIDNISSVLSDIQEHIERIFWFSVTIGVGTSAEGVKNIKESYSNAISTIKYRLVYGRNTVIDYSILLKTQDKEYEYPDMMEKHVLDALKLGNTVKLNMAFNNFFDNIKQFSYGTILLSLTQLSLKLVSTGEIMAGSAKEGLKLEYEFIHQQLITLETLEDIKNWLLEICQTIIEIKSSKADYKKDETVQKIINHIENNYFKSNLSVDEIANIVNFSPNYVRIIFKNNVNKSISDYITEQRFDKAKELLLGTRYTVKKISEQVGFSDSGYFNTAFKRYFGITPEEFRKSNL